MDSPHLTETLGVHNMLGRNIRILQIFGLLPDDSLPVTRSLRVLSKGILALVVFIHVYCIFGSVMQLILSDEDSNIKLESGTLILSYIKGGMQVFVLIVSRQKFLDLIKYAEVNFFVCGQSVTNTDMSIIEGYVQTARRLTGFFWATFALALISAYIELIPSFFTTFEIDANESVDQSSDRRRTVAKVWTPFQKIDSPYLKLDIIYELMASTVFFIIFTAINLLTLLLIIFFTGHFNILGESMENVIKNLERHALTGITSYSMKYIIIQSLNLY
jgi:hypothetical protein